MAFRYKRVGPGFTPAGVDVFRAQHRPWEDGRRVGSQRRGPSGDTAGSKAAAGPEMPPPIMAMRVIAGEFRRLAFGFRKGRIPARIGRGSLRYRPEFQGESRAQD